jgi:hypothetical protein
MGSKMNATLDDGSRVAFCPRASPASDGSPTPEGHGVASRKSNKSSRSGQKKNARTRAVKSQKKPRSRKKSPVKLKRPTKKQQRDPRVAWNYLRKLGLIKSKRNARKIKKSDKLIARQIKKFKGILSGKDRIVPLDKKTAKAYKKRGETVVNDKLIEPKKKGERVTVKKRKIIRKRQIKGGELIIVSVPLSETELYTNLEILREDDDIAGLLEQGYRLSVRFGDESRGFNYGYRYIPVKGIGIDRAIDEFREYIEQYESVTVHRSAFGTMQLILVKPGFSRPESRVKLRRHRVNRKGRTYIETYERKSFQRLKHNTLRYEKWKAQVRSAMKRYRAKKKGKRKRKLVATTRKKRK